jgi:hypothetical protein
MAADISKRRECFSRPMILDPHNYLRPSVNEAAVFAVIYRKLTATGPCFSAEILGVRVVLRTKEQRDDSTFETH